VVLCLIASLVSFWDIRVTFDKAFSVSFVAILIFIVATTVYNSKYEGGLFKGKQTTVYREAFRKLESMRNIVQNKDLIDSLGDWCNDFRRKDLETVKKNIVCPYMTFSDYTEKYALLSAKKIKDLELPKKIEKAVIAANKVESIDLTSDMLLNLSFARRIFGKRKILPISGDSKKQFDMTANYVKRFFVGILCGFFIIEILSNPTLSTFIQWMIRMIPVAMSFITGPAGGYKNATEIAPKRMNAQSEILAAFLHSKTQKSQTVEEPTGEQTE
jgi:hypothetical protein